jgi:hypothetical protein
MQSVKILYSIGKMKKEPKAGGPADVALKRALEALRAILALIFDL